MNMHRHVSKSNCLADCPLQTKKGQKSVAHGSTQLVDDYPVPITCGTTEIEVDLDAALAAVAADPKVLLHHKRSNT